MKPFEPGLIEERPDAVVAVGEVNSTIACALVSAKIVYPTGNETSERNRPLLSELEDKPLLHQAAALS